MPIVACANLQVQAETTTDTLALTLSQSLSQTQAPAQDLTQDQAQTPMPALTLAQTLAQAAPQAAAAPIPVPAKTATTDQDQLIPFEVIINNNPGGNWVLWEHEGKLYAPSDAFEEWRVIRARDAIGIPYHGQTWYPLSSVPGFEEHRNLAEQSVELQFSPSAFAATRLSSEVAARPPLSPVVPAAFLNYDMTYTRTATTGVAGTADSAPTLDLSGLTELGFSNSLGVLTSSYVGHNIDNSDTETGRSWRRLETTFTANFPDDNITLRLGDATTRASLMGRSAYFGGIQIGNNFALTPGFVTQPIPVISGLSSTPSTLSLFVNDALRQTSTVPTGPFTVTNFPQLTGAGEATVVVKDLLGRESVVTQHFFTDPSLLEKGLSDWSVESGELRSNLGVDSADYSDPFASGVYRYGLNKTATLDVNAQVRKGMENGGLGLSFEMPFSALGQTAFTVSNADGGLHGAEWLIGAQKNTTGNGFSIRAQGATRQFQELGLDATILPQKLALSASYVYSSTLYGALNFGLAKIDAYDTSSVTTFSTNYTIRLGQRSSLSFNATRVMGQTPGNSVGAMLTVPLGPQIISDSNYAKRSGETDAYTSVSKGVTSEIGMGWRALVGTRSSAPDQEAGLYYQGAHVLETADISNAQGVQTERLGAQGALVFIDNHLFASRRVDDSFALVEVDGYPEIGVGFQGSTITRTDGSGAALLPRLLPYQNNSIRLDPTELPINAEIDNIEQVVVPASRSAVKVVFPVRSGRGALITIVLENGSPAPAGAQIELVGDTQDFFVARRGEAFVTGMKTNNVLKLKWKNGSCELPVKLPPGKVDDIPRLGPLTCKSVTK